MAILGAVIIHDEEPGQLQQTLDQLAQLCCMGVIVLANDPLPATREVAQQHRAVKVLKIQEGLPRNEWRDKTILLGIIDERRPEYVIFLDGDDVFDEEIFREIEWLTSKCVVGSDLHAWRFPYFDFIDSDTCYAAKPKWLDARLKMWKWQPGLSFAQRALHATNCPRELHAKSALAGTVIMHQGYQTAVRRIRKYRRYQSYSEQVGVNAMKQREFAKVPLLELAENLEKERSEVTLSDILSLWETDEHWRAIQEFKPEMRRERLWNDLASFFQMSSLATRNLCQNASAALRQDSHDEPGTAKRGRLPQLDEKTRVLNAAVAQMNSFHWREVRARNFVASNLRLGMGSVLDLGEGIADDALAFAECGWDVTYASPSPIMQKFARHRFERAGYPAQVLAPEQALKQTYDVVICLGPEPLPATKVNLRRLSRCCRNVLLFPDRSHLSASSHLQSNDKSRLGWAEGLKTTGWNLRGSLLWTRRL